MKKSFSVRHGDVQIRHVAELPTDVKKLDRKELAYGEATGHAHRMDVGELFETKEWDRYMKLLDAYLVHQWLDTSSMLHYELYDFKERKFKLMPRLLKMESPELNDGTRPFYIEPVDPGLKTCQSARRWQFMKDDGSWPSVDESNKNPELKFLIES